MLPFIHYLHYFNIILDFSKQVRTQTTFLKSHGAPKPWWYRAADGGHAGQLPEVSHPQGANIHKETNNKAYFLWACAESEHVGRVNVEDPANLWHFRCQNCFYLLKLWSHRWYFLTKKTNKNFQLIIKTIINWFHISTLTKRIIRVTDCLINPWI